MLFVILMAGLGAIVLQVSLYISSGIILLTLICGRPLLQDLVV